MIAGSVPAQTAGRGLSEILGAGTDLSDPGQRARVVAEMQQSEALRKQAAVAEAARRGLPARVTRPGGRIEEVVDWRDGQLLYFSTQNVDAAISTGAALLRGAPYSLNGSGITIGVWDGGSVRSAHQEFGGRVTVRDGSGSIDHATHVAGTVAATGLNAPAHGMASLALIDSYDWNNDTSEMTARGAATASDPSKLFVSNQSYGYITGWNYVGLANRRWEWNGTGTNTTGLEDDFGRYHSIVRDVDSLAYNAPYFLMFRSAGNEREDNPVNGESVLIGSSIVSYNSASHPAGDGTYRGGFDSIGFESLAKNVMTVGSVSDAVSAGVRNPSIAAVSSFSSWGPTDDGRIKPDVVANGEDLFSSLAGNNFTYGTYSGTSMSSPNAAGSAALTIELYRRLFPGQAMRAATLKALLIQTADDLGRPGPDYKYGWGLVNVQPAADLIQTAHDFPDRRSIAESDVSTTVVTRTHNFAWDGVSPIRATLCWTDPAGAATTTNDSRTARLANNLNLKIVAPGGTEFQPFVMPFVGTWTQASMDLPAIRGVNNTDNVEQIIVAAPPATGTYQAIVSYSGSITNTTQRYSLIMSGTASSGPLPPAPVSITPDNAEAGVTALTIAGSSFQLGAAVKFTLAGQPDVPAAVSAVTPTSISCSVTVAGMAGGFWTVTVTNPDSQAGSLPSAFGVIGTIWSRNFDTGAPGWTTSATAGVTNWALVNTASHSPSTSWFASGPATKNTDNLESEAITVPGNASQLKLKFWHRYNLESGDDGGVLEFSVNGGNYFRVTNSGTAEAIIQGGYNVTLNSPGGPPSGRNTFAGQPAWSGNSGAVFSEVVVSLTDTAKYAGNSLRARWRLGTNNSVASPGGWYVDSVSLTGIGGVTNQAPSILNAAAVDATPVTGLQAQLSVTAGDDGGENALTYAWTYAGGRFDRPVTLSDNGTNAAKNVTATFAVAGAYNFMVTVRDAAGATTTSNVDVTVRAEPAAITVSPGDAVVVFGAAQQFAATVTDQFNDPVTPAPVIAWSVSGGGVFNAAGLFTATAAGGPFTVTATAGTLSGQTSVTVAKAPAFITLGNLEQVFDGTVKNVSAVTSPADLPVSLTYNGSAAALVDAGTWPVEATIVSPNYTGTATAILVIAKASAVVTLAGLTHVYEGTAKTVTATTIPEGLSVLCTYNGSIESPINAGSYAVEATVSNSNYTGTASGTLVISKATVTVTLTNLSQIYDGTAKSATATTIPEGLSVVCTYNGNAGPPLNAGSYALAATVSDANYAGEASETLIISKAPATVTLTSLTQIYDGTAKSVTATTLPEGLSAACTYNGSAEPPVNAGSYAIEATVSNSNYTGVASGTLIISKATATVTLTNLSQIYDGTPKTVTAVTSPPGLNLDVRYGGQSAAPFDFGSYEVTATVADANYQGDSMGTLQITGIPLATWKALHFFPEQTTNGDSADHADPDFDGYDNLAEYACGTDPLVSSSPVAGLLDSSGLSLTFTRPRGLPDVLCIGEAGSDLTLWDAIVPEIAPAGGVETVRWHDPATPESQRRFLRVRFVRPE